MYPRGGGIWDQDPILMRDFRHIRKFEREWREAQDKIREAQQHQGSNQSEGGGPGLGGALDQYIEHLKEEGEAF